MPLKKHGSLDDGIPGKLNVSESISIAVAYCLCNVAYA